ncbi:hypothetical protein EX895_000891 [Sporisorium graminicola]|uniref:Uncharacterized protein n=1 Tax=Sporisorium graminicola TaxID=280036 RepID=A0A4U7L152_9BASI|nr:hypothetical protein EX895_000891 [Sporisorium graminicola]TKY90893.1 hypothetical protein EX895_000891 [Sporisorium graminicola]
MEQPRFAKVKRTVSGHPAGNKAYQLGPNLKKRTWAQFLEKAEELQRVGQNGGDATRIAQLSKEMAEMAKKDQHLDGKSLRSTFHLTPDYGPSRHVRNGEFVPGETSEARSERFTDPSEWRDAKNRLDRHDDTLGAHRALMESNADGIDMASNRIVKNADDIDSVKKALAKQKPGRTWPLYAGLGGSTLLAGGAVVLDASSNERLNDQSETISNLSKEVTRLKTQKGQLPTSVNGPGRGAANSGEGLISR